MKKTTRCVVSTLISAGLVLVFSATRGGADGGRECDSKRALNGAEKAAVNGVFAVLKGSLPAAPKGWKLQQAPDAAKLPAWIAGAPGCPVFYEFESAFYSMKNAMEMGSKMGSQRMTQIAMEIAAAMQRGDTKRAEELQKEMEALQKGATPAEGVSVTVRYRCNGSSSVTLGSECKPVSIPGAKYAFMCESANQTTVAIYLGRWTSSGGSIALADSQKNAANTSPQAIEIVVFGQSASTVQDMARKINLRSLTAVIK
ncbi:MAG TPA: hypothetical protein PLE73_02990 [Spirochaetota bacterium]|mgnify:CR=1 FL=1|nr:hypothetical protein [Spirochaetota bacterium]HPI22135.1 hypothetical protein [Spirochaetota bacterium]HPU87589.1 hypothetical protein [Spirochaetota bacterium]